MHVDMDRVHNNTFVVSLQKAGYQTGLFGKYVNAMPNYCPKGWNTFMGNDGGSYLNPKFQLCGDVPVVSAGANYTTAVVGNASISWIKQAGSPFFAYIAPKAIHEPFNPAPWYADHWEDTWPMVERQGPAWNATAEVRSHHGANVPSQAMLDNYAAEVIAGVWRNRWRSLMSVDDLIAGVHEKCNPNSTYFIYTSDHGFQLGQFNMLMDKRHVYDWDTRVHLIVKGPNIRPKLELRLATNVDLAPTILELARVSQRSDFDGRSLAPLLSNQEGITWRDSVFIEYYFNDPNNKCLSKCKLASENYPTVDSSCANLSITPNALCWGGCTEDCYPTENNRNNFIGLRIINASLDLLYVKYETGNQSIKDINFQQSNDNTTCCFHELFDAKQDPWMLSNLYNRTHAAVLNDLDDQLMACFRCSGRGCP